MNGKQAKKIRAKVKEVMKKHKIDEKHFNKQYKKVKRAVQAGIVSFMVLFAVVASADKLQIPSSCYPKEVQASFAQRGYKLDLSGNDRTEESWGFLDNRGNEFCIYTYRSVTDAELQMVLDIVFGREDK